MTQTSQSSQVLPCVSILYVYLCHHILYWEDEATYPAYHRFGRQLTSEGGFIKGIGLFRGIRTADRPDSLRSAETVSFPVQSRQPTDRASVNLKQDSR